MAKVRPLSMPACFNTVVRDGLALRLLVRRRRTTSVFGLSQGEQTKLSLSHPSHVLVFSLLFSPITTADMYIVFCFF